MPRRISQWVNVSRCEGVPSSCSSLLDRVSKCARGPLASRYAFRGSMTGVNTLPAGGLIRYGLGLMSIFRQLGIYSGKILGGAKPADFASRVADQLRAAHQSRDRRGAQFNRCRLRSSPAPTRSLSEECKLSFSR